MRQVLGRLPGVEGEFQHFHTGKICAIPQVQYTLRQEPQIFGNELQLGQMLLNGGNKCHAGAGDPLAVFGSGVAKGYGPVCFEAPEVIQPDHIIQLSGGSHTVLPPDKIPLFHHIPTVQGIAPKLTVFAESIGRTACHRGGRQGSIQLEQFGVGPHIDGVVGHINRHITDDLHAGLSRIASQSGPLDVEQILHEAVEPDLLLQLVTDLPQRIGIPEFQGIFPLIPGLTV